MSLLVNREVILAKVEGTYGVDPTPVEGVDAILVEEPSWSNAGLRMIERKPARANIGALKQIYGGALRTVTFSCEVKGSGAAGTSPEIDPLIRSCKHSVTIDPGVSVTYKPGSTTTTSCTIYYYQDGTLYKLLGCRGNVEFSGEAGGILKANFTMTGHSAVPTDVPLASPTYDSTVPVPLISAQFTANAYAGIIANFSLSPNNNVAFPPSMNATDGYGDVIITSRDCSGSFDPEATTVAAQNWEQQFKSGSELALNLGTIGATGGNRYRITADKMYYREVTPSDREGIRTFDIPFGLIESSGDDEYSLIFT